MILLKAVDLSYFPLSLQLFERRNQNRKWIPKIFFFITFLRIGAVTGIRKEHGEYKVNRPESLDTCVCYIEHSGRRRQNLKTSAQAENRHFKLYWMGDHSVSLLPFVNG